MPPKTTPAALALLAGLAAIPARAQGVAALLPAPAPKSAAAPALSPAESRQLLDLLNDPQKRAAFSATLETLSKAAAVAGPAKPADAAPVKLAPDSLGAQLISQGTAWIGQLSGQFKSFGRLLGDLPSVWIFTRHTLENSALRARALDGLAWLAAVLAASWLGDWTTWRLLRRPMRGVARAAPAALGHEAVADDPRIEAEARAREAEALDPVADADADEPPRVAALSDPAEEQDVQHALRRRRFAHVMRTLRRLPFVLLALVLDLMPLGVFLALGYGGALLAEPQVRPVLGAAILAYAACRAGTAAMRLVVAPEHPNLRLVHVSDRGAAYAVSWVRRIFAVAAFGFSASQIGLLYGLPAQADDAFLKAVFLLVHLMLVVVVLQCRASVAARIRSHSPDPGIGGKLRNRVARVWHLMAIFYIVGLWLVWAAEVRHGYVRIWHLFLLTAGVLVTARVVGIVLLGGLERAMRVPPELRERYPGLERRANRYLPVLRATVSAAISAVAAIALLEAWGVHTVAWFRGNALGGRLASAALTVLVAAAVSLAVWEVANAALDRHLAGLARLSQPTRAARLRTLLPILRTVLFALLATIFALTALSEIGVNIAPLLAGAGILGVAIGFGSQKLVQDFITGIFLLIENAMQVGDWVTVAGLSGSVENISIRTMRLRAGDGSVHIIPFSSVSTVTNVNRGIGNAAVSVNVPIDEDTDRVGEVLAEIAREMRQEERFAELMRSDLQLWGVDRVDAGVATVVGQIVCTDGGRWSVQREFNRRMAMRFKERGLRIATPVTTVYNHIAADTRPALAGTGAAPPATVTHSPPPSALGNTA